MEREKMFSLIAKRLKKEGARKVAIFGSYARNEEKKNSDIDILVYFKKTKSLLEIVRLERELSKMTGKKVDLLTEKAISPYMIKDVKKEMKVIHA